MRLSADAYVWNFQNQAYIFQNRTGMSYLMNETVFDLLTLVRRAGQITLEELISELAEAYEMQDCSPLYEDIKDCVHFLVKEQILISEDICSEDHQENIAEEFIDRFCIDNHQLQRVCIELTYRCNEKCKHCYVADEEKNEQQELTYEQYVKILDDLRRMNVLHVTFTGGEVAVRNDFVQIVEYAIGLGFAVEIYSNGIGFTEDILEALDRLHPRSVSFSLYSGNEEEHDALTQVKGSFRRTLYSLMRLKCAGIFVSVKCVAMKPVVNGFEALSKLCEQLNVGLEVSYFVCASNRGCLAPTQLRLGDVEAYKCMMRLLAKKQANRSFIPREIEKPICGAGALSLSVNPYGDVFPCNGYYFKLGNALSDGFEKIWQCDQLKEIYRHRFTDLGDDCVNCLYRDDCLFCMGAALAENGDVYKRIPEACLIARAAYEIRLENEAQDRDTSSDKTR